MKIRNKTTVEFETLRREQCKEDKSTREICQRREFEQRRGFWNSLSLKMLFD